jgi:hypothetical protein
MFVSLRQLTGNTPTLVKCVNSVKGKSYGSEVNIEHAPKIIYDSVEGEVWRMAKWPLDVPLYLDFLNAAGWALVFPKYRTDTIHISFPDRAPSLLTRRWHRSNCKW